MRYEEVWIDNDNHSYWLGQIDYKIELSQSKTVLELKYIGEPPHGDSYHKLLINSKQVDGYFWGCNFIFPEKQRYVLCSWMKILFERKTILIDINNMRYSILAQYWYDYKIDNNVIIMGNDKFAETKALFINEIKDWITIT